MFICDLTVRRDQMSAVAAQGFRLNRGWSLSKGTVVASQLLADIPTMLPSRLEHEDVDASRRQYLSLQMNKQL